MFPLSCTSATHAGEIGLSVEQVKGRSLTCTCVIEEVDKGSGSRECGEALERSSNGEHVRDKSRNDVALQAIQLKFCPSHSRYENLCNAAH